MSADEELNAMLSELGDHHRAEFDVEKGLARLRAANYGFDGPEKNRTAEEIGLLQARGRVNRRHAKQDHQPNPDSDESAIAVLEGILLADDLVQVDLSKLEGEPTGRAIVYITKTRSRSRWSVTITRPSAPSFLVTTFGAVLVAACIAGIAAVFGVPARASFVTTVTALVGVFYQGNNLLRREIDKHTADEEHNPSTSDRRSR